MSVVEDAVSLGKSMGLGMDGDDVEELAEAHSTALTTEELPDLQREQQLEAAEELSSEEEGREAIPPSLIRKCLGNGEKCTVFFEKYYPDKQVEHRAINVFDDNAVFHSRQVLKCREKRTSSDRFSV